MACSLHFSLPPEIGIMNPHVGARGIRERQHWIYMLARVNAGSGELNYEAAEIGPTGVRRMTPLELNCPTTHYISVQPFLTGC